jgi:Asp-tRNA(Asn)/Glu-tRNA(Gln) amidotransferase A subunit family amidase
MGLTSRDGIVPLNLRNDIGGPMARNVEDAARVLGVIAGHDLADPITERSRGRSSDDYTRFLEADGLKGARIGVFRHYTEAETTDPQVKALFDEAVADIEAQGAVLVDPFEIPDFEELSTGLWEERFRVEINAYLAALGDDAPYRNLKEVVDSGLYYPPVENRLKRNLEIDPETVKTTDVYQEPKNVAFRKAVLDAMEEHKVEAIIYPTWSNPPRKVGDMESPHGDNSQRIPPGTGLPGLTVPMGYTYGALPAGLQIVGRLFGEPDIIRIAYAYEQTTGHRRPPSAFPKLP